MAIEIKHTDGETYTLDFSRRVVQNMQRAGFNLEDALTKQTIVLPQLFSGAFAMHHPKIKEAKINEIYAALADKEDLFPELIDLYRAPIEAMFDEPEEEEKKATWKKV